MDRRAATVYDSNSQCRVSIKGEATDGGSGVGL